MKKKKTTPKESKFKHGDCVVVLHPSGPTAFKIARVYPFQNQFKYDLRHPGFCGRFASTGLTETELIQSIADCARQVFGVDSPVKAVGSFRDRPILPKFSLKMPVWHTDDTIPRSKGFTITYIDVTEGGFEYHLILNPGGSKYVCAERLLTSVRWPELADNPQACNDEQKNMAEKQVAELKARIEELESIWDAEAKAHQRASFEVDMLKGRCARLQKIVDRLIAGDLEVE